MFCINYYAEHFYLEAYWFANCISHQFKKLFYASFCLYN